MSSRKPEKNKASNAFQNACERRLVIRDIPLYHDAVQDNYINAGWILSKMDLSGGKRAFDYIGDRAVTVGVDAMSFHRPVKVGDLVSIYAEVVGQGRTSVDIRIESWAHSPEANEARKVTEGLFTFVNIDQNGRPKAIDKKLTSECNNSSRNEKSEADSLLKSKRQKKDEISQDKELSKHKGAGEDNAGSRLSDYPPRNKTLVKTVSAENKHRNYLGDIFGGWILANMDRYGAEFAHDHCGKTVATVGVDAMSFHKPVRVGDEVEFFASIEKVGNTSISISIEAWAQKKGGECVKVTEGMFTYVAFNKQRKPIPVFS